MPGCQVVNNAMLMCSFGTTPSTLSVLPTEMTKGSNQDAATIMDHKPNVNIKPFGMCITPSNPQVASATAAALGVLTPQPCMPVTTSPWTPGSPTVTIGNKPALDQTDTCMCTWGGVITITMPGATIAQVQNS